MKILPAQIQLQQPIFSLTELHDNHPTMDNPRAKTLQVFLTEFHPAQSIKISGDDYIALGQWTDESLNQFLITKFGLIPA